MSSLVLELQRECLDSRTAVADVLRKAIVVARKLGVTELQEWLNKELNGYDDLTDLPSYRRVYGQLQAWDPYRNGWIPFIIRDPKFAEVVAECRIGQRVGELEDIARSSSGKTTALEFPFSPTQMEALQVEEGYRPSRLLSRTHVVGIIDSVRNVVLNWTLKLEEDGILGQGMTFDSQEKAKALHANYTVNNFFGGVSNSQIQQGGHGSTQSISTMDLAALREVMKELGRRAEELELKPADAAQFLSDVQTAEAQLSSPRPNRIVVRELIASITNILEGCAGSVLASGLLHKLTGCGT